MMTAQRGISLRRKPQSPQRPTSSRTIHSVEKGKLRRSHFMACRWRVIKFFIWLRAQSFYNVGALLVLLASLAVILYKNSSSITTGPENAKSVNVAFQKSQVAGGSTFRSPNNSFISDIPSYGGIILDSLDKDHFRREIKFSPESESTSRHWEGRGRQRNERRNERYAREYGRGENADDDDEEAGECRRVKWRSLIFANCNSFHELDEVNAGTSNGEKLKYLGSGHYRAAWLVDHEATGDHMVLKQLKLPEDDDDTDHTVNPVSLSKVQKDAIVMERLTASPRIVDAYGYCGTSILAENMPYEVAEHMVPGTGNADQEELDQLPALRPVNNYTIEEKLDMAIEMSEALADLHGASGGVILHGDVHPVQWLRSADGSLKLNDFNGCEVLEWNEKEQKSCKTNRGMWGGNYRSPEEYRGDDIDEKIDVYSMGNNLYTLMTGLWPFYEEDRYTPVIKMVKKRKRPYIDPRWRRRSYIEKQFVEIMMKMWRHRPEERPDIFTVVEFLKYTKRHAMDPEAEEAEETEAVEHTDTSKEGQEFGEAAEETEDTEAVAQTEDTDAVEHTDTSEEGEEVNEAEEAEESEKAEVDSNESRRTLRRRDR